MNDSINHDNIINPIQEALVIALDERDELEQRIETLEKKIALVEKKITE